MPDLQSGHWDPTDPWQLITCVDSCSFGSGLINSPNASPQGTAGALPNTPLSLRITQQACLLRQLRQRDQQSTLTHNTMRDGGWCTDMWLDWRLVVWTLLEVEGRSRNVDRCAEVSHDSVRLCTSCAFLYTATETERHSTNLPVSVWCIKAISSPLYLNPFPQACEKSFKLHSAQALSTSVQNIIKWLAWGCLVWTLVAERLWCNGV